MLVLPVPHCLFCFFPFFFPLLLSPSSPPPPPPCLLHGGVVGLRLVHSLRPSPCCGVAMEQLHACPSRGSS